MTAMPREGGEEKSSRRSRQGRWMDIEGGWQSGNVKWENDHMLRKVEGSRNAEEAEIESKSQK